MVKEFSFALGCVNSVSDITCSLFPDWHKRCIRFEVSGFCWFFHLFFKNQDWNVFFLILSLDLCHLLTPPCFTEEDKYSLEALRTIHKQMDDDKDGGIEVEESDEVGVEVAILLLFGALFQLRTSVLKICHLLYEPTASWDNFWMANSVHP